MKMTILLKQKVMGNWLEISNLDGNRRLHIHVESTPQQKGVNLELEDVEDAIIRIRQYMEQQRRKEPSYFS